MYSTLVEEIVRTGHEVRVIAPVYDVETHVANEAGIPILRVKSGPMFNTSLIVKTLNNLWLNSRYKNAMQRFWPNWSMDWIITPTPPITLAPFIQNLKTRYYARCYLILRDIFPQNAKDLGMIKIPLFFAYFRHCEQHLYKISDIIGCMSPGNIEFLRRQDPGICSAGKVTYFPNWIQPTSRESQRQGAKSFRQHFNLEGKFIALFGGNFGKPQKIEFILDLAWKAQHLPDVVFFSCWRWYRKRTNPCHCSATKLEECNDFDRLPRDEYQSLITGADIGLVNLSEKFTVPNIPSRTLGYWDACLPVLAATDSCTDLNETFLEKYNAGLWAETGNIENYNAQFMRLYQNEKLRRTFGKNGRKVVENGFFRT